jgi:TetR/AcrR family transcriptional repressor of nem operon
MKVSRVQRAEHRRRILDAAGRLFRSKGFDAVTVAEVMHAAGLTHGGFYRHFGSKDDLVVETLAHVLRRDPDLEFDLPAFVDRYLSPRHREATATGCPVAGLASDTRHQTPPARAALTAGLRAQLDRMSTAMPGPDAVVRRRAAIGSWSAMVGAVILARAIDDRALSDAVLEQTRAWIGERTHATSAPARRGRGGRRAEADARASRTPPRRVAAGGDGSGRSEGGQR